MGSGICGFAKTSSIAASMLSFEGCKSEEILSTLMMAGGSGMPGTIRGAANLVGAGKQGVPGAREFDTP